MIKFGNHIGKLFPFNKETEETTTTTTTVTTVKREKPEFNIKFMIYSGLTGVAMMAAIILTIFDADNRKIWISCLLAPFGNYIKF